MDKCENCEGEIQYPANRYVLHIGWEDVGKETGIPFEDDLHFYVCSVKCGLELIEKSKISVDRAAELSIKQG